MCMDIRISNRCANVHRLATVLPEIRNPGAPPGHARAPCRPSPTPRTGTRRAGPPFHVLLTPLRPLPSGYGNQVQALLAALFLSTAANRTLIVPPLLSHHASAEFPRAFAWETRRGSACAYTKRPTTRLVDRRSLMLVQHSERSIGEACRGSFGPDERKAVTSEHAWGWFDVAAGFPVRAHQCSEQPVCSTLHATLLQRERELLATSPCRNRTLGLSDAPSCAESIEIVRAHEASPLCLGPLNDRIGIHVLPKCAATHPMAKALMQFGLPLRADVDPLLLRRLPPTCGLCVYARIPDAHATSKKSRAKLMASLDRRIQRLATNVPTEVVANCRPWAGCEAVYRNLSSGRWIIRHPERDAGLRAIVSSLGVAPSNAGVLFDQVRCARCARVEHFVGHGNRLSEQSTFLQQIQRLHARFSHGLEFGRSDLADALQHSGSEIFYGADFPPQAPKGVFELAERDAFLQRRFPHLVEPQRTLSVRGSGGVQDLHYAVV